jgi:hypothetical protein
MSAAFMGKMAVAVLVGAAIGNLLPAWLVRILKKARAFPTVSLVS